MADRVEVHLTPPLPSLREEVAGHLPWAAHPAEEGLAEAGRRMGRLDEEAEARRMGS